MVVGRKYKDTLMQFQGLIKTLDADPAIKDMTTPILDYLEDRRWRSTTQIAIYRYHGQITIYRYGSQIAVYRYRGQMNISSGLGFPKYSRLEFNAHSYKAPEYFSNFL